MIKTIAMVNIYFEIFPDLRMYWIYLLNKRLACILYACIESEQHSDCYKNNSDTWTGNFPGKKLNKVRLEWNHVDPYFSWYIFDKAVFSGLMSNEFFWI